MNNDPIARARRLGSVDAARELYDTDVFDTMGVTGTRRVAELTAEHVTDRATPIIDLGCGTGAVGRHLADHGFTRLTGLDLSPGMLAFARSTGSYQHLAEADLNDPPEIEPRFGAAVSAGTFTTGHVGAGAVPALLGLLRPGAWLVWAIAPSMWPSFETALAAADVTILRSDAESIRPGTDDRSHMVVGRCTARQEHHQT